MRAYHISGAGQAAALTDVPLPPMGDCDIHVTIRACGLNFADLLMQKGTYQDTPDPPFTLGMEVAGVVRAVGAAVRGFAPGDRVAVFGGSGGLATEGIFPADRAVLLPDAMSFEHGAAFQIAYGTSHLALVHRARLQPGETLLVLGAAGGVGLTAVEIGARLGARVIAVARGDDKLAVAGKAGAAHLIDAETADLRGAVKALGGADVVYDAVGGDAFRAAFRACNPEGRLIAIGFASGDVPQIPANHLMVKNIDVLGVYWGGYMKFAPQKVMHSLAELAQWYAAGKLHPHVSHVLPLDRVAEGMDLLRRRASTGKVVIVP
ncbi:MAG: NADPH:quinone oxidoreductase family protein [Rhodobacteraceae bacterium]|nr:NADPH:quinone oxidoreductase family protein [Paracoccaceae bacterium]